MILDLVRLLVKLIRVEANVDKGIQLSTFMQEVTEVYEEEVNKRQKRIAKDVK